MRKMWNNKIAMIDDDEIAIMIVERMIKKTGLAIEFNGYTSADSFLSSIEKFEISWPSLLFVDINMPIMNGWEFLEELQNEHLLPSTQTVICMLTSSDHPDDISRFNQNEIVDLYFKKPFKTESFLDTLKYSRKMITQSHNSGYNSQKIAIN